MRRSLLFAWLLIPPILLTGCVAPPAGGPGQGMRGGMMERHHAAIPAEYAGRTGSVSDGGSLARGAAVYVAHCASCHGDGGMGDGPAGAALDPAPAPIARTSQMLGDDYLFWRVSEGGAPFKTAMPAWKDTLDDQARWDIIQYVQALGRGEVEPVSGVGGALFDPEAETARRAAILAQAIEQGVIAAAEAETFNAVHTVLQQYRLVHPDAANIGATAAEREAVLLAQLIEAGTINPAQAETFTTVHDRLAAAGLAP